MQFRSVLHGIEQVTQNVHNIILNFSATRPKLSEKNFTQISQTKEPIRIFEEITRNLEKCDYTIIKQFLNMIIGSMQFMGI